MMSTKKGLGFGLVKNMIVVVLVSISLFLISTNFLSAADSQSKAGMCGVSAVFTDLSGRSTFELGKVKWNCPIGEPQEITVRDLKQRPPKNLPQSTIDAYNNPDMLTLNPGVVASLNLMNPEDKKALAEYNMNRIVAKKLEECYIKTGFTRAQLFDRWYSFLGWGEKDAKKNWEDRSSLFGLVHFKYPIGCGICSAFYVPTDVQKEMFGEENIQIQSLPQYLRWHPAGSDGSQSKYDKLELTSNSFQPTLQYQLSSQRDMLYVVIRRHEISMYEGGIDNLRSIGNFGLNLLPGISTDSVDKDQPISTMEIIRSSQLSQQCTFITNEFQLE